MREYKFRAWDRYHREMIDWEQYKGELVSNDFIEHGKGPLVIMQYTGMKDINDVDIYEGDLIAGIHRYDSRYSKLYVVEYYDVECRWVLWEISDAKKMSNGLILTSHSFFLNECEVVGNIYENPELMNR